MSDLLIERMVKNEKNLFFVISCNNTFEPLRM